MLCAPVAGGDEDEIARLMKQMEKDDYAAQAAHGRLVEIGLPAGDALLAAIKHTKPHVRYWSAAALAQIGENRAYGPLKELVRKDPNQIVRSTALWHLQLYGNDEVYKLAADALGDAHPMVRGWAMRVLRENRRKEGAAKLRELVKSEDVLTRADAVHATVVLVEGQDHIAFLKGVLSKDPASDVRLQALRCLTIIRKDPKILDVMIDALGDSDEEVRRVAVKLLRKGADQVFGYIPTSERAGRKKAADRWRSWYEKDKSRLTWNAERRRFEIREES